MDGLLGRPRQVAGILFVSLVSAALASSATVAILAPTLTPAATPGTSDGSATPAVVTISTSSDGTSSSTAEDVASSDAIVAAVARVSPSVVTITTTVSTGLSRGPASATGVGSGVIYTSSGYILTNNHVVEGATAVSVTLMDGSEVAATVARTDAALDLAVIKIDATGLSAATIGSSADLQVGETVIAIGSPLGEYAESVTTGVLSGTGRTVTVSDPLTGAPRTLTGLLQTDAAINQGNSGGPLLDAAGDVIGINTASATSAQGLGFAVPIDAARALMSEAQASA